MSVVCGCTLNVCIVYRGVVSVRDDKQYAVRVSYRFCLLAMFAEDLFLTTDVPVESLLFGFTLAELWSLS